MWESSECADKTVLMSRLVWAFVGSIYYIYQKLMFNKNLILPAYAYEYLSGSYDGVSIPLPWANFLLLPEMIL